MHAHWSCLALAALSVLLPTPADAQRARTSTLSTASGGRLSLTVAPLPATATHSEAIALSSDGYLAFSAIGDGYYDVPGSYLMRPDGSIGALGGLNTGTTIQVTGVANGGRAVGYEYSAATGMVGLLWAPGGLPRQVRGGLPHGLSDSGVMAGYDPDTGQAVRWGADGLPQFLPTPYGTARPRAVNHAGWLAGDDGRDAAVVWRADGSLITLPPPAGFQQTNAVAYGINDGLAVTGWVSGPQGQYAYRWTPGSGTQMLPGLGGDFSWAQRINNAGQVVGSSVDSQGNNVRLTLWTPEGRAVQLLPDASWLPGGIAPSRAEGLNNHGQIALTVGRGNRVQAAVLTLQPSWTGGNGSWSDVARWDWGGTGAAALEFGEMHDVVIDPGQSARVLGGADITVRSLKIGGDASHLVQLDLANGQTRVVAGAAINAGSVLRGSGTFAVQDPAGQLSISRGGQVLAAAGDALVLDAATVQFDGSGSRMRIEGTAAAPASLTVTGQAFIGMEATLGATRADASFGQLIVVGRATVQDVRLTFAQMATADIGRLQVSFGRSTLDGNILNQGLIVVSNGAEASFLGNIDNLGELRVSAGGAANFFGHVGGPGQVTGSGSARFEGGLDLRGASAGVLFEPALSLGAGATLSLDLDGTLLRTGPLDTAPPAGGRARFSHRVTLEGGMLALTAPLGLVLTTGQSFDLFDWDGGVAGSFGAISLPSLAAGLTWDTHSLYEDGVIRIASVPEPASWALILGGMAWVVWLQRRRPAAG